MNTLFFRSALCGVSFAILMVLASDTFSQPALRMRSRQILRRTAVVILHAQKVVKEHKVYTGNFARAVTHQRMARRLFYRGMYVRAIHHSRRARMLALMAIKANKQAAPKEWEFSTEENQYSKNAPPDSELEAEANKEMPGQSLKDEDAINYLLNDMDVEGEPKH